MLKRSCDNAWQAASPPRGSEGQNGVLFRGFRGGAGSWNTPGRAPGRECKGKGPSRETAAQPPRLLLLAGPDSRPLLLVGHFPRGGGWET